WRPRGNPVVRALSRCSSRPIRVDAHAWPQTVDLLHRIGANGEGPQIEIAGSAGRTPAGIFALGGDDLDFGNDPAVAESRDTDREAIAELEPGHQILAQRKPDPGVAEVDEGQKRDARDDDFARFDRDLVDLRGDRRTDRQLVDQRLDGLD